MCGERKRRDARETMIARLVIGVLALTVSGCARPDWIEQTLVTVDVTGAWRGEFRQALGSSGGAAIELTLQQSGPKVSGQVNFSPFRQFSGPIEGTVTGDMFRFRAQRTGVSGELQVNGDEMTGRAATTYGPGTVTVRRQP